MNGFADSAKRLGEILDPIGMRHVACLEMHLGHPQIVPANESIEDFRQKPALLPAQPAHDAEIDGDDATRIINEEIALVHVGVEKSVAQRGAQKGLDQAARQCARIKSEPNQTLRIGHRDAVDPLHRHHFARGAVPVDGGRANVRIVCGIFREFRRRRGFEPEIHLHPNRAGERLDHLAEAQAAELRRQTLSESRSESHIGEIARKSPFSAGAQHFDRHGPQAVVSLHLSPMHLGDRSGSHRLAEALEQRSDLHPKRGLDDGDRRVPAHRRDAVLQLLELQGDFAADDVRTG